MRGGRVCLTIANRRAEIARIGEAVQRFATDVDLDAATIFKLELIADELITNAVSYGYPAGAAGTIEVALDVSANAVRMTITDDGIAHDPLAVPPPSLTEPLETRPIGGLGTHIVRTIADRVSYRRSQGRNIVTCVIALPDGTTE